MVVIAFLCIVLPLARALWWATKGREMAHLQERFERFCE